MSVVPSVCLTIEAITVHVMPARVEMGCYLVEVVMCQQADATVPLHVLHMLNVLLCVMFMLVSVSPATVEMASRMAQDATVSPHSIYPLL